MAKQIGSPEQCSKVVVGPPSFVEGRDAEALHHNLQQMFAQAVERETPEVLRYLRNMVWPEYDALYWQAPGQSDARTQMSRLIVAYVLGNHQCDQTSRLFRIVVGLAEWRDRFHLQADWMLSLALDVMLEWSELSAPNYREDIASMTHAQDLNWADDLRLYRWSAGRTWTHLPPRIFEYEPYAGQDPDAYKRQQLDAFRQQLDKYVTEERRARAYSRTPTFREADFALLALSVCRNMTAAEIGSLLSARGHVEGGIDERTLHRRIAAAAQAVGIPAHRPGRPAK